MALIDTSAAGSQWIDNNRDLVTSLRLALVEELAAVNTYERLACGIRRSGFSGFDGEGRSLPVPEDRISTDAANALADSVLEIAHDELTHVGKITEMINMLSPEAKAAIAEGAVGV